MTRDSREPKVAIVADFATAWQPDLIQITESLTSGWRAHLERAVDTTVAHLTGEHAKHLNDLNASHARRTERLAQSLRRLRQFENETQWSNVVADASQLAAKRVIVFSINSDKLRFHAARGFDNDMSGLPEIPLAQAGAFEAAVASSEPAVALKTQRELSAALTTRIGEDASQRIAVYPITTRQRVAALVYAEDADGPLLDAIVTAAGAALEAHLSLPKASSNMVAISPAAGAPFITRDEEERHSRAQRFARVQVAEIRLYDSQAVKAGRADANLYRALKPQLDEVRRVYQEQYLKNAPNMTDYLHQEILRTLANGNQELLGPDYPGPLV